MTTEAVVAKGRVRHRPRRVEDPVAATEVVTDPPEYRAAVYRDLVLAAAREVIETLPDDEPFDSVTYRYVRALAVSVTTGAIPHSALKEFGGFTDAGYDGGESFRVQYVSPRIRAMVEAKRQEQRAAGVGGRGSVSPGPIDWRWHEPGDEEDE